MDINKERIFVDESGDPGLSNLNLPGSGRYFVFGYVYSRDPAKLRIELKRLLRRLHRQNKYPNELKELKFYLPPPHTKSKCNYTFEELKTKYSVHLSEIRSKALCIINDFSDGVFAAVVDKEKAQPPAWHSKPLQSFVFSQTLFANILNFIQASKPPEIIYDEGRLSSTRDKPFDEYVKQKELNFQQKRLKEYSGTISVLTDTTSVSEAGIWAADMVAGSFYHKYAHLDDTYSKMVHLRKIGYGERLFWR